MTTRREELQAAGELALHLEQAWRDTGKIYVRHSSATSAAMLLKLAARLAHYAETECNYGLTEGQKKRVAHLMERVRALLPPNVTASFNGDPRGYAVKLHFVSGAYNTWGGKEEGWGI